MEHTHHHSLTHFMRDHSRWGETISGRIEIGVLLFILFFLIEELANKLRTLCHKSFRSLLASDG